jgi:N-acetylmuramoyl-L-alanine amidase
MTTEAADLGGTQTAPGRGRRMRWSAALRIALVVLTAGVVVLALGNGGADAATTQATMLERTQQRLADLGFLVQANVDGRVGLGTQAAIVAFQKWEGLPRTGVTDARTRAALGTAARPAPIGPPAPGRRLEVLVDRQVMLAVDGRRVVRTIDVSTGKPSTPTPIGSFRVYAKYPRWWSSPFAEWLFWAAPFDGGIAVHQYPSVPPYAASHGCVRVTAADAPWVFRFVSVDTPVHVLARSVRTATGAARA